MKRRKFLTTMSAGAAGAATGVLASGLPAAGAMAAGPTAAAIALRQPRMADELCRHYMVNTKLFYAQKVYGHTDAVIDLLTELGARGVRERVTTGTSSGTKNQLYAMPRLANNGVRWHATVGNLEDWANATAVNKEAIDFIANRYAPMMGGNLDGLMHSFGGCNEIDGPGRDGQRDPDWVQHARTMQKALWAQATNNPTTNRVPVAGPSTRTDFDRQRAALLGDLSQISELGNGHLYNKGKSPTAEIDEHLDILAPCYPGVTKYLMTETGYNNSPQDDLGKTIPEFASAIYAIRGLCDFFKRDTVYGRFELLDDPNVIDYSTQTSINRTAQREAHFGLVAMTKSTVKESTPDTWRKKAEFYATKHLLGLLTDEGPDFTPQPFGVTISGGLPDLQHTLLQKRDGRHYLVLWRDVEVSTLYPDAAPINVAPTRVTVQLDAARPIAVYAPNRGPGPIRTLPATRSIEVSLRGELKVVEIG